MRRLTIRTFEGKAILNCYDCEMQHAENCDRQMCRKRLVEKLAYFEDLEDAKNRAMKVKLDQGALAPSQRKGSPAQRREP